MTIKRYRVVGPNRVHGTPTGEVLEADLDEQQERRLIAAGHIKPEPKKKAGGDQEEKTDG